MKTIIGIVTFIVISVGAIGQQSLFEAAEACKDMTFIEYYSVSKEGDGNKITGTRYKGTISTATNRFGKPVGIEMTNQENGKKVINYNYRKDMLDRYSLSAYSRNNNGSGIAYLIIDSVLFELEKSNEDLSKFKIDAVWIAKGGKSSTSGTKKKMSLKEKAQALKAKASGGNSRLATLKEADLDKMIADYLAAMRKKQDAQPMSSTELNEAEVMKFAVDSANAAIKGENDAYWASPEGIAMKKRMYGTKKSSNSSKVTIKNEGSQEDDLRLTQWLILDRQPRLFRSVRFLRQLAVGR